MAKQLPTRAQISRIPSAKFLSTNVYQVCVTHTLAEL